MWLLNLSPPPRKKKFWRFQIKPNKSISKKYFFSPHQPQAFVQEVCKGWKQNYLDGTYGESQFFKDFQTLLNHEKGAKTLNGLERKPGEGSTNFFFITIVDATGGRKFTAVKTNIIMDLEEKALRQRAAIDMKKERQKNKRRKNKKPVPFSLVTNK